MNGSHRILAWACLVLLLAPTSLLAGGRKKEPTLQVSFHLQTSPGVEGSNHTFTQATAGKEITYRRVPEIATKDVVAFTSFPADDQQTYGVVLQLSEVGSKRLTNFTAANRGKYLLAMVNGQVRDAVLIDQAVNDGFIVIWKWISVQEIRMADNMIPRIGVDPKVWEEQQKKKK